MTVRIPVTRDFLKQLGWRVIDVEWAAKHKGKVLFDLVDGNNVNETRVKHYIEFADEQDATVFRLRFGL